MPRSSSANPEGGIRPNGDTDPVPSDVVARVGSSESGQREPLQGAVAVSPWAARRPIYEIDAGARSFSYETLTAVLRFSSVERA